MDLFSVLTKLTDRELLEILTEVFYRRQVEGNGIEYKRWFLVQLRYELIPENQYITINRFDDEPLEAEYLALPVATYYENEIFFEMGLCKHCKLPLICTHKTAICPYCHNLVGCS